MQTFEQLDMKQSSCCCVMPKLCRPISELGHNLLQRQHDQHSTLLIATLVRVCFTIQHFMMFHVPWLWLPYWNPKVATPLYPNLSCNFGVFTLLDWLIAATLCTFDVSGDPGSCYSPAFTTALTCSMARLTERTRRILKNPRHVQTLHILLYGHWLVLPLRKRLSWLIRAYIKYMK